MDSELLDTEAHRRVLANLTLLSLADAGALLGISPARVLRHVRAGHIRARVTPNTGEIVLVAAELGDSLRVRTPRDLAREVVGARRFSRALQTVVLALARARQPLEHRRIVGDLLRLVPQAPAAARRVKQLFRRGGFCLRRGRYASASRGEADVALRYLGMLLRLV